MNALSQWLHQLGLERYIQVFAENDVDLEAVCLLSDNDLAELGLSLGHRRKLLKAVSDLNAGIGNSDYTSRERRDEEPRILVRRKASNNHHWRVWRTPPTHCHVLRHGRLHRTGLASRPRSICKTSSGSTKTPVRRRSPATTVTSSRGWATASSPSSVIHSRTKAKPSAPFAPDWTSSTPLPISTCPKLIVCKYASVSPPGWLSSPLSRKARWARP